MGAVIALIVAYGWPLTGPARVAHRSSGRALREYALSLAPRFLIVVIAFVPGVLVVAALAPSGEAILSILSLSAGAVMGLSPSWYFIGRGDSARLALYETLPRMAAGVVALGLVFWTHDPIWYPASMLVGTAAAQAAFSWRSGALKWLRKGSTWRRASHDLRLETPAALAMVAGGAYSSATVGLVAVGGSVGVVAVYGMADRLFKASLTAIVSAANAVQGWVSEDPRHSEVRARARRAVLILGIVGAVGAAGIAALGPTVTAWFFGPSYRIDYVTSSALGLAFLAVALSTGFGRMVLVPVGRVRLVTASTIVGAVAGVPAIIVASAVFGVRGAAIAFGASEVLVTLVQLCGLLVGRMRDPGSSRNHLEPSIPTKG
ncbi:hypothetical protein [Planctomonas sp. JC2975]|uniref:hypothetical protein n=1 Tax=Planctomonas sp. JC2975 TaxID=2729626 RepID=UPI00197C4FC2|nr:hypothetical protein [Planctomonas sp. JC2975]